MQRGTVPKVIAIVLMLAASAYMTWDWWHAQKHREAHVYFYDLSAKRLFVASGDSVPPITGLDGTADGAVRAVVFSPSGDCDRDQAIAYLEKYSPELKAQFEAARRDPAADIPRMSRARAQSHTFVRRLKDTSWHSMDSEEAARIVGEWRLAKVGHDDPVICVPP
jgi:hypothetical protein